MSALLAVMQRGFTYVLLPEPVLIFLGSSVQERHDFEAYDKVVT
jgi:hypothetical protein